MIPVRVTREFMYLRRPVLVAVSLADLRGPVSGIVELPLHLFWSGRHSRDGQFSLDDPSRRRDLYRTVLREARSPDDLATFLNGGMLTDLWARLVLPKMVRKAWEDQHPALRPPVAPAGLPARDASSARCASRAGQRLDLGAPTGLGGRPALSMIPGSSPDGGGLARRVVARHAEPAAPSRATAAPPRSSRGRGLGARSARWAGARFRFLLTA